jgi:hypothetical protein
MNTPAQTVRALQHLFPAAKFGRDVTVHAEKGLVTHITTPRPLDDGELEAAIAATANQLPPAPAIVGKGQLYAALVAEGWFATAEQADAAITAILLALPETQAGQPFREVMRALFLKAGTVEIGNPLTEIIRQSLAKTTDQRDALFRRAATF